MSKLKSLIFISSILFIFGCVEKNGLNPIAPLASDFIIGRDYKNFTSKMENSDTLKLTVNLSMCGWMEFDEIVITKNESQIYIQVKEKRIYNDTTIFFPKVPYELKNDTLDLEKMINEFDANYIKTTSSPFFIITHPKQKDTIVLRTTGLFNRGFNIQRYNRIMFELYPKEMDEYYLDFFGQTYNEYNRGI
ncbi:hypothetical protein [Flagellimonas zhangzhouensis]|uniref:Lipoprotein n=1 Tax=Flagellimonas zhangzhouensis TaxID=1073328 RepID=A0A1H2YLZ1_9FLAO|nr:hypothetical protein [Allomuricauda zhangzhouensis]SDR02227.1 hypothetical protein SAMN05216294_3177 [Allomuricauda zhangzhouensis]SDX05664.1 hypothetical protein SAMN04487892_3088 [Allomuricauda zhangzhouensis]